MEYDEKEFSNMLKAKERHDEKLKLIEELKALRGQLNNILKKIALKENELNEFDLFYGTKNIRFKKDSDNGFSFAVNIDGKIIEATEWTGDYRQGGSETVKIIDGEASMWNFIGNRFLPYVNDTNRILSCICEEDAVRLTEVLNNAYNARRPRGL